MAIQREKPPNEALPLNFSLPPPSAIQNEQRWNLGNRNNGSLFPYQFSILIENRYVKIFHAQRVLMHSLISLEYFDQLNYSSIYLFGENAMRRGDEIGF